MITPSGMLADVPFTLDLYKARVRMRFLVSGQLEYDVVFPSTLILNIHAQRCASQTILEEQFHVEPYVKVEEFLSDNGENRFVRLETGRKKHLSIHYQATV